MEKGNIKVSDETIKEYNDYRQTLGYPKLTRKEVEHEFNLQDESSFYNSDNPKYYSAQRYTKDENGNIIYDPNWEENLQRWIE